MAKLQRSTFAPFVTTILLTSLPVVWAATTPDSCEKVFEATGIKAILAEVPAPKLSSLGKVLIPGGVPHTPARNQRFAEICWSYALNGLAEGRYLARTGRPIHLSPDHNAFWHVYFQMKNHLGYFTKLNKEIAALPNGKKADAIREAIDEFYGAIKSGKDAPHLKLWQPSMGSRETIALKEVAKAGFVPDLRFDAAMKNQPSEDALENAVKTFIGENLLNEDRVRQFEGNGADGINDALFKALSKQLEPALGAKPIRPNETFTYNNQEFTPMTFMRDHVQFNPDDWTAVMVTAETHDVAMKAMVESLKRGNAVPIGLPIFGDRIDGVGPPMMYRAEKSGIFSPVYCNNGVCKIIDGGHEVLTVNARVLKGKHGDEVGALIAKNSWGETALDVNGKKGPDSSRHGYYIFTNPYLKNSFPVHDNWDMVIEKDLLKHRDFAKLRIEPN